MHIGGSTCILSGITACAKHTHWRHQSYQSYDDVQHTVDKWPDASSLPIFFSAWDSLLCRPLMVVVVVWIEFRLEVVCASFTKLLS